MYDSDIAKDIDDLLEELLFDSDINPLKKKIIDLIKSREEN